MLKYFCTAILFMIGLTKTNGVSFEELTAWLTENQVEFKVSPIEDEDNKKLYLGRKIFIISDPCIERDLINNFGLPNRVGLSGKLYRAYYEADINDLETKDVARIINKKIIEDTIIVYPEKPIPQIPYVRN